MKTNKIFKKGDYIKRNTKKPIWKVLEVSEEQYELISVSMNYKRKHILDRQLQWGWEKVSIKK